MRISSKTKESNEVLAKYVCTRREMLAASGLSLAAALKAPLLAAATDNRETREKSRPNIIVFLADALRAEHLGCFGYSKNISPRIDAMAESSFVFERCYSQTSWTKPSIASLFTGYLPCVHQTVLTSWELSVLNNWDTDAAKEHKVQLLRNVFDVLAENFQGLGYQTALFQTNPHCQKQFGFGRGFDFYRYVLGQPPRLQSNEVIKWLSGQAKDPFFLFIHEVDPHGPYVPEPRFYKELFGCWPKTPQEALSPEDLDILTAIKNRYKPESPEFNMQRMHELSQEARQYLISLYDAEIRGVDYHFGRILDHLTLYNRDDNTIVAFISDHGEAFGEHGFYTHNNSLYDEELHVPLIIRVGNKRTGVRVPWNVSLFDLFPTLVSLAGGIPTEDIQAKRLLNGHGELTLEEHRPVYAYFDRNRPDMAEWQFCVIQDGFKVIDYGAEENPEIYSRTEDPAEKRNLYGEIPESETLLETAQKLRKEHYALADTFGEPEYGDMDTETLDGLRALGYL